MQELQVTVTKNVQIADGIYLMSFRAENPIQGLHAGRFVNVSLGRADMILKRPFGLFDFSADGKEFSICYQIVAGGTQEMSTWREGKVVDITAPLGNGFTLNGDEKVVLIGGGVGIFPLHSLKFSYPNCKYSAFIGFRNQKVACHVDAFSSFAKTYFSTDDGSFGEKGNAVDLYLNHMDEVDADVVLACGPTVMLKALKAKFAEKGIMTKTYVSTEERMGCGVGACLVCVCGKKDANGDVKKVRVCHDGPVFDMQEVEL